MLRVMKLYKRKIRREQEISIHLEVDGLTIVIFYNGSQTVGIRLSLTNITRNFFNVYNYLREEESLENRREYRYVHG